MRVDEGNHMLKDLLDNCRLIGGEVDAIAALAPLTIDNYRNRLTDRVKKALEEFQVELNPTDLLREISIFTERVDISEENRSPTQPSLAVRADHQGSRK